MIPEDKLYLSNIYEAALKIESYTESGRAAFMSTPIIQDAVIRNFEIIGEATKRLSYQFNMRMSIIQRLKALLSKDLISPILCSFISIWYQMRLSRRIQSLPGDKWPVSEMF